MKEALQQTTFDAYPYESEAFHNCWWEYLAPKFKIAQRQGHFLVHQRPTLKGLFTCNELRLSGWNNDAVCQDMTEARVRHLETFSREIPWDYFRMNWSEDRAGFQAFDRLRDFGYPVVHLPIGSDFVVDLSQGWDAYLNALGKKTRYNIQQKLKNATFLSPELVEYTGFQAIDTFFQAFFAHHVQYWDKKAGYSYFNAPQERDFIVAWAKKLERSGNLILQGLSLGGKIASMSMFIRADDTLYWPLTINTTIYTEYFPGLMGLYLRLQQAAEEGVGLVKLCPGQEWYKSHMATYQEKRYALVVPNHRSLRGRAYSSWLNYRLH